ncbi:hypothetical protein D9M72_564100 [compost metagenome]
MAHIVGVDATMVNGLQFDQGAVGTHRERCRTDIATARQGIAGGTAATFGQAITQHLSARLTRLAQHFDASILAQKRQDLFKYRAGQRQAVHQPRHVQHTGIKQMLAHQLAEKTVRQTGFADSAGLRSQALYRSPIAGVGITFDDDVHD